MAVVIAGAAGTVILSGTDAPERLPLQSSLSGQARQLSDGSEFFEVTGWTPHDVQIEGTLYNTDGNGTPLEKARRLLSLHASRSPVTLTWPGGSFSALITQLVVTPLRREQVQYQITLYRGVTGGLVAGATTAVRTRQQRAGASVDALAGAAQQAGPRTQAAAAAAVAARSGL